MPVGATAKSPKLEAGYAVELSRWVSVVDWAGAARNRAAIRLEIREQVYDSASGNCRRKSHGRRRDVLLWVVDKRPAVAFCWALALRAALDSTNRAHAIKETG